MSCILVFRDLSQEVRLNLLFRGIGCCRTPPFIPKTFRDGVGEAKGDGLDRIREIAVGEVATGIAAFVIHIHA